MFGFDSGLWLMAYNFFLWEEYNGSVVLCLQNTYLTAVCTLQHCELMLTTPLTLLVPCFIFHSNESHQLFEFNIKCVTQSETQENWQTVENWGCSKKHLLLWDVIWSKAIHWPDKKKSLHFSPKAACLQSTHHVKELHLEMIYFTC